ncbi:hypothetical protein BH23VER1_BH23VER1_30120 [soil metagenome]
MKARLLPLAAALAGSLTTAAPAANFFFSIDTLPDGTGGGTLAVSALDGFSETPTIQRFGTVIPTADGGEAMFTDFEGTVWLGSGGSNTPGHSLVWNPGSVDNSLQLSFSMTGLQDFSLRFAIRSAHAGGGSAPTQFNTFTYDVGGGELNVPGVNLNFVQDNTFHEWTADLGAVDAIDDQPSVTLRWTFDDLATSPAESFRADNFEAGAVAIPEPGAAALVLGAFGLMVITRRVRR